MITAYIKVYHKCTHTQGGFHHFKRNVLNKDSYKNFCDIATIVLEEFTKIRNKTENIIKNFT